MSRYIDADRLSLDIKDRFFGESIMMNDVLQRIIIKQPTADVVEVVRCKDCKYDHKCSHNIIRPSKGGGVIYCSLEYCSEGEKADT